MNYPDKSKVRIISRQNDVVLIYATTPVKPEDDNYEGVMTTTPEEDNYTKLLPLNHYYRLEKQYYNYP